MKSFAAVLILCVAFAGAVVQAQTHSHGGAPRGSTDECRYCGMDRQKFAHSAMLIEYEDGTATSTCSLHCTAVELAINIDKTPRKLMVGDYVTKKQTNAETACWTLGGDLPGDDKKGQMGVRKQG